MVKVEIYSGQYCPYCMRAKALLTRKGVSFTEYDVQDDEEKLVEMLKRSGGRQTIPQIFIDDEHLGGCDDIYALDAKGELDKKLKLH